MSSNHARVETPATTAVATSLPEIDDLLETGEPVYVLYRTAKSWPRQHRMEATEDGLETACNASEHAPHANYELTEFDPDGRKCQHQNCFGPGPLPVEEIDVEGGPAEFETPRLRPADGGRIHKLAEDRTRPACSSRLHKTSWVVVEEDEIEADAEKCSHQNCFGDPAELRQPDCQLLCSRSSNRVHKVATDRTRPACNPQAEGSDWFVAEPDEVGEDAEECGHQNCFGEPPELEQMERPRLHSLGSGRVHKVAHDRTRLACDPQVRSDDCVLVEADEVEEDAEECGHQNCFGEVPELEQMERPRLRSASGGRIHKLADDETAPACNMPGNIAYWTRVDGNEVDEAEKCEHPGCFGSVN